MSKRNAEARKLNLPLAKQNKLSKDAPIERMPISLTEICITPIPLAVSVDVIYSYCNANFGIVESVNIRHIQNVRVAIVSFRTEAMAKKALTKKYHKIGKYILTATRDCKTRSHMLSLDDQYFEELLRHLDVLSLITMASVNGRLRRLVRQYFALSPKDDSLTIKLFSMANVEVCLQKFGSRIRAIHYDSKNEKRYVERWSQIRILYLLWQYCVNLTNLKLENCIFDHHTLSDLHGLFPLFRRLDKFTLENCSFYTEMFSLCNRVEMTLIDSRLYSYDRRTGAFNRVKTLDLNDSGWTLRIYFICYAGQPKTIEYIEVDVCWKPMKTIDKFLSLYKDAIEIANVNTFRMYDCYGPCARNVSFLLESYPNLSELVWGYPTYFTPANLLEMVKSGTNLCLLIVIFSPDAERSSVTKKDDTFHMNKIVDMVSMRPNETPLSIIIVGRAHLTRPFNVALPALAPLKMQCLLDDQVQSILKTRKYTDVRMSTRQVNHLHSRGLLSN